MFCNCSYSFDVSHSGFLVALLVSDFFISLLADDCITIMVT